MKILLAFLAALAISACASSHARYLHEKARGEAEGRQQYLDSDGQP